ncbi:family 43 glycosylhydrolase [Algibacter amylolyticus]|uniref:Family 43 glycosylhydrolase n=1 Tax=Algibacter amylolyticus TaxID=1608400 RepID=A0A5M7BA78_9FLAO|nr:family 43 glycosylhydrolase [Algibacter amylolyticus]KAA5825147.1 family 43 glycosylhydrolase [Algibacter amylolyticus]MBB5268745.1 beta-xylosidase [Algibacter amylolyticus]TSJ77641.1 family 43 glycosylhydrolase [Algibacter amylolyticus]
MRKQILLFIILGVSPLVLVAQNFFVSKVASENQHIPDQGNGLYKNPIFPGKYGDPSIVRVDKDYYVAFSKGANILIWHSLDLVNWEPIKRHHLPEGYDRVWAIDLQYFNNKFHIYMPVGIYPGKKQNFMGNFVITAEDITGAWSDPINLEIEAPETDKIIEFPNPDSFYNGIDPGFIQTPEGDKYLYLGHGFAVELNDEGTKAVSKLKQYYTGWDIPESWIVECKCLESPKLFYKDGYYYMVSAQGGTAGPATAHMSIVARSKQPLGPWENSPHNPLTHTYSHEEPFWHQGHGTVFKAVDGSWYTIFHGRVKGYTEMGRPTFIMPLEWTTDGWPVIKDQLPIHALIPMPKGEKVAHGMPLSDNFNGNEPSI